MKISIILPNLLGGGAERLSINLANEFIRQGNIVEFVILNSKGDLHNLIPDEASLTSLDIKRMREAFFKLRAFIKRSNSDVFLVSLWPLTSIFLIASIFQKKRKKIFICEHTRISESYSFEQRLPLWMIKIIMILSYPLATQVIAVSKGVKEDLMKLSKVASKKISVIYNPVAGSLKHENNLDDYWDKGVIKILSIGSLKKQKDFATLIRAIKILSNKLNVQLIILGEGPERDSLENLVIKNGLQKKILLPGFKINPANYLSQADIFVLSSAWEGFGNVLVEALEYGLPIVSTDCNSGPSEILQRGKFGELVHVGDYIEMSKAIIQALDNPLDKSLLMNRAKDFSVNKIAREYLDLFNKYE